MSRLTLLLCLIGLLASCNLFEDEDEPWIYAETPIPPVDERNGQPLVMILGDSIAAGWMDCRQTTCSGIEFNWPEDAIGEWALVRNRGIGSSTTSDLLDRWEQDTADADVIIIISGVNDLAQGRSTEQMMDNFREMQQRASDAGITPIFSTIMPADTTTTLETFEAVNAALRSMADEWLILDLSAHMTDPDNPGRLLRSEIAHEGSSHPNAMGYARMTAFLRQWWQAYTD